MISVAGCLMVPAGLGAIGLFDLVSALATIVGFFAWIFLLVAALVVGIKGIFQRKETARTA
jgi:hypothetical protein